ncbi:hypothetical protein BDV96DRAFT_599494 [Lophiotrema nucula]|uniref:C2H2-type domain-containing protein n=1 Tax=Lophiotrema nucula TaxID=690887 RepID=A0A6A5Z9K7_9PLEO|nr:hypothetical protein BDV96DRAFT_599494 [Lophiotrema nucula]
MAQETHSDPNANHEHESSGDKEIARSIASRRKSVKPGDALHTCQSCFKQFKRPCDLTKHEKTHLRPWKCNIQTCKYYELGWPTEKERDRHVNDKHASTVPQFKCLFPPCTYSSKRESNCKQHMEKTHNWVYVRSKSNGKRGNTSTDASSTFAPPTPLTPFLEVSDSHILSYSTGIEDSRTIASPKPLVQFLEDSDDVFVSSKVYGKRGDASAENSRAIAPTKPFTPFLETSNDLIVRPAFVYDQYPTADSTDLTVNGDWDDPSFGEPFNLFDPVSDFEFHAGDNFPAPSDADGNLFIPPALADLTALNEGFSETKTGQRQDPGSSATGQSGAQSHETDVRVDSNNSTDHNKSPEGVTTTEPGEVVHNRPSLQKNSRGPSPHRETVSSEPRASRMAASSADEDTKEAQNKTGATTTSPGLVSTKRAHDDQHPTTTQQEPPCKKQKKACQKRNKRRLLSCIFRKQKPDTYNFNNTKFKTCHTTSHEYVSTLLRHLERYHNAIICHCCLATFESPEEGRVHKAAARCTSAGGSQEEKWQNLYSKLCGDGVRHDPAFESACAPQSFLQGEEQNINGEPQETGSLSQATIQLQTPPRTPIVSPQQHTTSLSLDDAERQELERLRQENNKLLRENNVLLRKLLQWESVCGTDLSAG